MTVLQIIGVIGICLPFAIFFGWTINQMGLKDAAYLFGGTAALCGFIIIMTGLATGGIK